jgi:hypothetical protein
MHCLFENHNPDVAESDLENKGRNDLNAIVEWLDENNATPGDASMRDVVGAADIETLAYLRENLIEALVLVDREMRQRQAPTG